MATDSPRSRPSLLLVRTYRAPPEKVWRAWTEPEALKHWIGPDAANEVLVAEVDLRVGGRYRLVFTTPDGEQHDARGVYREIVPGRKLVFTWKWHGEPEIESLVTVSLEPAGAGTQMRFHQEPFVDEESRRGHESGWNGAFDKLGTALAGEERQ